MFFWVCFTKHTHTHTLDTDPVASVPPTTILLNPSTVLELLVASARFSFFFFFCKGGRLLYLPGGHGWDKVGRRVLKIRLFVCLLHHCTEWTLARNTCYYSPDRMFCPLRLAHSSLSTPHTAPHKQTKSVSAKAVCCVEEKKISTDRICHAAKDYELSHPWHSGKASPGLLFALSLSLSYPVWFSNKKVDFNGLKLDSASPFPLSPMCFYFIPHLRNLRPAFSKWSSVCLTERLCAPIHGVFCCA